MTLDSIVALGVIAMQIATIAFLALYFLRSTFPDLEDIASLLSKWGLQIGFTFSLGALLLTLYYSDILGIPPCPLCWWGRIFLYPQVVLFGLAIWKQDRGIAFYSIWLSSFGLIVALYNHMLQMFPSSHLPCPATGEVSCSQIFFLEFGYITFPLMGATLFAFLIVLMMFVRSNTSANPSLLKYTTHSEG